MELGIGWIELFRCHVLILKIFIMMSLSGFLFEVSIANIGIENLGPFIEKSNLLD